TDAAARRRRAASPPRRPRVPTGEASRRAAALPPAVQPPRSSRGPARSGLPRTPCPPARDTSAALAPPPSRLPHMPIRLPGARGRRAVTRLDEPWSSRHHSGMDGRYTVRTLAEQPELEPHFPRLHALAWPRFVHEGNGTGGLW